MKIVVSLFLMFVCVCSLGAQSMNSLDTVNYSEVTELSAVQTKYGTFLSALMIRHSSGMDAMIIYRSVDNGSTWDSVFFKGAPNFLTKFPDPVLCTGEDGNVYAAVMGGNSTYYDIWVFKSTDDGLTWNFVSKPYGNSDLFCDLPSIKSRGNGLVYVSYSAGTQYITFKRSLDGGLTWLNSHNFPPPLTGGNVYPSHLDWTINNRLCLSYGDMTNTVVGFVTSNDSGATWDPMKYVIVPASANVTKIVSRKNFAHLGVIAHKPHVQSDVFYLTSTDTGNTWTSQLISNFSANCEGVMDAVGNIHIIYNEVTTPNPTSRLSYRYSSDKGQTFSSSVALLSWTKSILTAGEYQSLILGLDGLMHVTYIDWNDNGAARHLVFAPLLTDIHAIDPSSHAPRIYPNPAREFIFLESDVINSEATYVLKTMEGKSILTGKMDRPATLLDLRGVKKGIYLLMIASGQVSYVQKIVKE